MIADKVNMNRETLCLILTEELGMKKICARMVRRNLTEQQRDLWRNSVLTSKYITMMLQTLYSPDLALCDLFLFQ
jgi:hypothetical protein